MYTNINKLKKVDDKKANNINNESHAEPVEQIH